MNIELDRPTHVSDDAWAAIESHRVRLQRAVDYRDHPLVIGCAKELIESVARVTVEAVGSPVVSSNAEFDQVVGAAHTALERQPGRDVSMSADVRTIASSSRKIAVAVRDLRNDHGTGHGRGQAALVDEEVATVAVEASLLWCRWALRRLRHVLIAEASNLIRALRDETLSRAMLDESMSEVDLPHQPPDVQRALGVAFARRAATGTFVAAGAGVNDARSRPDLQAWPVDYRLGLAEGFTLTVEGFIGVEQDWIPAILEVLTPVPVERTRAFLVELTEKVRQAGSPGRSVEDLYDVARAMERAHGGSLNQWRDEWEALALEIDPTEPDDPRDTLDE